MSKMKPYTFLITDELAADLKKIKERDGAPESETIRRALRDYLIKQLRPVKERPVRARVRQGRNT